MDISSITNKSKYADLSNKLLKTHSSSVSINGVSIPVADGKAITDKLYPASLTGSTPTAEIIDYYAPSKIALDTYQKLGYDIDKSLESSFLLQTFNIKGTDILCSTFCFLISLLSCSARDALYQSVQATNQAIATGNTIVRGYNTAIETLNAGVEAAKTITNSVGSIFGSANKAINGELLNENINAAAVLMAVPKSLTGIIDKISGVLKYSKCQKYSVPDFSNVKIWNLSESVLFSVQAMFIQAMDEILNKIFKPVEDLINNISAPPCYNNLADAIRIKILYTITSLKSKIKSEIADIFAVNKSFQDKIRKAAKSHGSALELGAFLDALSIIGANFQGIAMGCGLTPCSGSNETSSPNTLREDTTSPINPFSFNVTSSPVYTSEAPTRDYNNIDDIATAFKDFLSPDNVTVSENTISSTYNIYTNAPQQIKDFVNNGILNYVLDSNYTVNPSTATVTYKFERRCA